MKYKLLVLDVDGTLLNDVREISKRTLAALLKVQQMGAAFPENNSLADILMLAFGKIREKIEGKVWKITPEEMSLVDKIEFESLILDVKKEYGSGFAKLYRDMPEGEFIKNVTDEMERWMFIKKVDDMHQIKICPLVGKIQGSYPQDYTGGNENEQ